MQHAMQHACCYECDELIEEVKQDIAEFGADDKSYGDFLEKQNQII